MDTEELERSLRHTIGDLQQENAALRYELKQADALREIRDGQLEELKERIKQERDFAEALADESRLIAIDRAEKVESSLAQLKVVLDEERYRGMKYFDLLDILKEAVEDHKKARKMGIRGSGVDSELYAALDKIR